MTTPEAEAAYLRAHPERVAGRRVRVFNPHERTIEELPVIYGFNNGGRPGWYIGILLAEDGTHLGSHCCSHEGYMPADLGVLEGTSPERHETFMGHYPDGYRMEFVSFKDVKAHEGLTEAYRLNQEKAAKAAEESSDGD